MPNNEPKTINAVETTFGILSAMEELEPAGLSDLASHLDIPTSTVFLHLSTLVANDYVVKEDKQYRRSFRFLEVGGSVRHRLDVARLLRNKVEELGWKTGEIAGAGIEENGQRVILYRSTGEKAAGDELPIGHHTEMHWTSLGKAILASVPAERRREIVEDQGLPRGTSKTLTTDEELERAMERVRQQGYAIDDEEHLQGVRGVAVPIFDREGNVLVSIGITGPRDRFSLSYVADLLEVLQYTKNEIEVRNQYYEYNTIDG